MKLFIKSTKKSLASILVIVVLLVASIFTYNTYMIKEYNSGTLNSQLTI